MYTHPEFVYIHFPKTGGNSIKYYLRKSFEVEEGGFHDHYRDCSEVPQNKFIFTSIRNPFDWYVSLWNVCKEGDGIVGRKIEDLGLLEEIQKFSNFLSYFTTEYKENPFLTQYREIGFFSVRFYKFFLCNNEVIKNKERENGKLMEEVYIDRFIKTENLEDDLINLLRDLNLNTKFIEKNNVKRNKKRGVGKYKEFYNKELVQLVYEKDETIFNKFNYSFD